MQHKTDAPRQRTLSWLLSLAPVPEPRRFYAAEVGGSRGPARQTHILIVEDDPAIADMYAMQLRGDGYRVEIAGDAEAALAHIDRHPPDLVLLDILLPGPDGFAVLEGVRGTHDLPVVILSNYGEADMIERGRRLGAIDYVVKSRMTPRDLSRAIPGWLRSSGP